MAESQTPKEENEKEVATSFKELGRSGTLVNSYTIDDDHITELNGVDGQTQYNKMLKSDSQIRKLYHAVSNPIRSAKWDVEPASDSKKDIEVAALIKHILFNDVPDGWTAKLDEILDFPWKGYSALEVIHKNRYHKTFGAYTGLWNLAYRDQRTITEWHFDRAGVLEKIHQLQSGDIEVDTDIPAKNLLLFFNEKKGNDIGYPFLRMLYGNYKRKLLYKEIQAIGMEKGALGVPKLKLPQGVSYTSDEVEAAMNQLDLYVQAHNAYFVLPHGFELDIDNRGAFDPSKTQVAIKAENEEISGSLIGMFLEMGIGGNSGNQAGTEVSADFFRDGIEYIANKIAEIINLKLIPNLVRLNFGEVETLPKLVHAGIIDEAGIELMNIVTGYVEKGVIQADEPLEDHVRKQHKLPAKAQGEMLENGESQDASEDDKANNNASDSDSSNEGQDEIEENEDVELSSKSKIKTPRQLITKHGAITAESIRDVLIFASGKYINDVMKRYSQLSADKKQTATSTVKMAGFNGLKKELRFDLSEATFKSIDMAKKEVPVSTEIKLSSKERNFVRVKELVGDYSDIKLNENAKLPTHIQVLIQKQAELIADDSLKELQKRVDFSFSSKAVKTTDEKIIQQAMEDAASDFTNSAQIATKANNVVSLMVNEGRNTYFFEPDVVEEIHSFTFMNAAPKSVVCTELAGTTFNTNDAESLLYSPPLHHNCKSYLRANLKTSKGVERLEVSTLSPSAKAKKSITL